VTAESERGARDTKGRFADGNPGGPGRPRKRPLRDVVTFEQEAELWRVHFQEAQQPGSDGRNAREFILRHVAGNPYQACPHVPPLRWPERVLTAADLVACVETVLTAHAQEQVDAAGLHFLVDLIAKLAKVFEVTDLAPKLRALEEHVAAMGGGA